MDLGSGEAASRERNAGAEGRKESFFLPLPNPSSFTFLICIILPSLGARDLREKVRLLTVYFSHGCVVEKARARVSINLHANTILGLRQDFSTF